MNASLRKMIAPFLYKYPDSREVARLKINNDNWIEIDCKLIQRTSRGNLGTALSFILSEYQAAVEGVLIENEQRKENLIEGKELPQFGLSAIHAMVILTLPGSQERERMVVAKTLLTEQGELVLVSKPYENLKAKRQRADNRIDSIPTTATNP